MAQYMAQRMAAACNAAASNHLAARNAAASNHLTACNAAASNHPDYSLAAAAVGQQVQAHSQQVQHRADTIERTQYLGNDSESSKRRGVAFIPAHDPLHLLKHKHGTSHNTSQHIKGIDVVKLTSSIKHACRTGGC